MANRRFSDTKPDEWYTKTETYRMLKISRTKLWRLEQAGVLCPAIRKGDGKVMYHISEINKFIGNVISY